MKHTLPLLCLLILCVSSAARAETLFFEAEDFTVEGDGWRVNDSRQVERASRATALNGAQGDTDSTAAQVFEISEGGTWRIWVRYSPHSQYRGPFDVAVLSEEKVVAEETFDTTAPSDVSRRGFLWQSFDAELVRGRYTLRLGKHEQKNASWVARNVDCFMITDDLEREPDHIPFGPQTWMRVTLGDGYKKPVQIHIFADHYRAPWYAHYAVTKAGVDEGIRPTRENMEAKLSNGETTGWTNISRMVYQDSGAHLVMYPAYTYHDHAEQFNGVIEFASAPEDSAVVKKFEVAYEPSTIHIVVPPNLQTPENVAKLQTDLDFASKLGKVADDHDWPTIGEKPEKFPFFISAHLDPDTLDHQVIERELKTLSYFGFNGIGHSSFFEDYGYRHKEIGNVGWYTKGSYSAPDMERMQTRAPRLYEAQREAGVEPDQIAFAMVMDEPTGEPASKLASDKPSVEGFRNWLKSKNLTPSDLLVDSWEQVKPVLRDQRDSSPALHYYTQQYRTVALGNFIAIQKKLLHEQWQDDFPVVVNFSDGAIYYANFYGQGVDYFTLLRETDQNGIWSEDWSNGASTYQAAAFNVELMRGAASKEGEWMGHHLIAYAGRKPYDIRLKGVSEVARGIRAFISFAYGPVWATHESSPWQKSPAIWADHAALVREIGAVEDMLMPAQPKPAEVALLYSSATDIWTHKRNHAFGFDRMHTWLALAHAQVPVDVVHENDVAEGALADYKVVYLSGPNITEAAAMRLRDWVEAGGTLILTAGAGQRDEFNRPLQVLDDLLPYQRMPVETLQSHQASGRRLTALKPQDTATTRRNARIHVLSAKQTFEDVDPRERLAIDATFADGTPAAMRSPAGEGMIVSYGYLPALDYIYKALVAKDGVSERREEIEDSNDGIPGPEDVLPLELDEKSYNPWQYPADVRAHILRPIRAAKIDPPVQCSVPLVDAVYMVNDRGVVIPLANYTLNPIDDMTLDIAVDREVREVRSVYQGSLAFETVDDNRIRINLPLDCTDFVTIHYANTAADEAGM